ncbi:MAG: FAD-dependent oxidoreductase [Thermodesulfobacteriota bacterium]|nr:FAD-dependent oxidoreductase [Thermodesulfobacteriota bacterium]
MASLTIYVSPGCPFCEKAKLFLEEKGIGYEEVSAPAKSGAWQEMRKKTGSSSLPQILVGDTPVGGYSELVHLEATGALGHMLGQADEQAVSPLYDVIIIGGGPAGLSAAVYAARKVLKTLVITKEIGGQVTWTYDVDNYLGFSQIDTADLVSKFEEHVEKYGVEKLVGTEVKALDLTGKVKKVMAGDGKTYLAKTIVLAMGKRPRPLNVPGEKELIGMGVTYCSTCDAPLFADLDVAVAGGGNSALEAVMDLVKVARKVYMVSLTPLTGDQILQDKVTSSPKVEVFTEHEILQIIGESSVEAIEIKPLATGDVRRLDVAGIIVEIGLQPNSELALDVVETNGIGEIIIDARCRTGVAGVLACGDVTDVPFKQVIVAAGEGAKAALSAYDYILNQR